MCRADRHGWVGGGELSLAVGLERSAARERLLVTTAAVSDMLPSCKSRR